MKLFDSHCHPQFQDYDSDRDEMIKRNLEQGVFMIAVGADLESSKKAIELADSYEGIWATVGLHPDEIKDDFNITEFEKLVSHKKVVAVGEVGLDHYRTPEPEKREKQKEVFKEFIQLALRHDKALVLHVRDAGKGSTGKVHRDVLEILDSFYEPKNHHLRGVAHSFTGTITEASAYAKLGFLIGLNGIITFSEDYDQLVKDFPIQKILLETDAPWLTPVPNRGKRNEPSGVIEVAKKIARLKNVSPDQIARDTFFNTTTLFKIRIISKFEARLVK